MERSCPRELQQYVHLMSWKNVQAEGACVSAVDICNWANFFSYFSKGFALKLYLHLQLLFTCRVCMSKRDSDVDWSVQKVQRFSTNTTDTSGKLDSLATIVMHMSDGNAGLNTPGDNETKMRHMSYRVDMILVINCSLIELLKPW